MSGLQADRLFGWVLVIGSLVGFLVLAAVVAWDEYRTSRRGGCGRPGCPVCQPRAIERSR